MNRALKSALIELKNEGVLLDPIADLEHILTLDKLALNISCPRNSPGESAALRPALCVGNLTLYRLSLGARRFLVDVVEEWFRDDMATQDLAYAYCMDIGRSPELLWEIQQDRQKFKKRLHAWEKTVGVSFDDLRRALKAFLHEDNNLPGTKGGPSAYRAALATLDGWKPMPAAYKAECQTALIALEVERDSEPAFYGAQIERLVAHHGKSPEDWIWRTAESELDLLLYNLRERENASDREERGAQDDRFMRAHRAFCEYKDMVVRIKKGSP